MIQRHRWSILSLAITMGVWAALGGYAQYQYHAHHVTTVTAVPTLGGLAVLASVGTGIIAARKEGVSLISVVAIVLGVLSIAFYTL